MKRSSWMGAGLALALVACADGEQPSAAGPVSLTSEALASGAPAGFGSVCWEHEQDPNYDHLTAMLPTLVGHSVGIVINVPSTHTHVSAPSRDSPWPAVERALALNIPVTLWPSLPVFPTPMSEYTKEQDPTGSRYRADPAFQVTGFFANASNADEFIARSLELKAEFERRFPGKRAGLLVDMEIRRELMEPYKQVSVFSAADQLDFFRRYGSLGRPEEYDTALEKYRAFVVRMRRDGWRMDMSTFVQMLDDYADGDASLRRAYGIVLDDMRQPGATPWDRVSFQAFTTLYGAQLPGLTNYFVYDYARLARRIFGAAASLDLGLTHGGIDPSAPVYWSPLALASDVSAGLAAGVPRAQIGIYSFLGMFGEEASPGNVERWLVGVPLINLPPPPDFATLLLHAADSAADLYFPAL